MGSGTFSRSTDGSLTAKKPVMLPFVSCKPEAPKRDLNLSCKPRLGRSSYLRTQNSKGKLCNACRNQRRSQSNVASCCIHSSVGLCSPLAMEVFVQLDLRGEPHAMIFEGLIKEIGSSTVWEKPPFRSCTQSPRSGSRAWWRGLGSNVGMSSATVRSMVLVLCVSQ